MSCPTSVHDPQEFPEDLDDLHTEFSLSSEPGVLISPPRSPSRLDFFDEGSLDHFESEADIVVSISRDKLADSLFVSRTPNSRDDYDENTMSLSSFPILHYTNSLEYDPVSPLLTESLAPDPVLFLQDQRVNIPSPDNMGRMKYHHHGFSRSAFLHRKSFWTARHDEWLQWQKEVGRRVDHSGGVCAQDPGDLYTGIIVDTQEVSGPPTRFCVPPSGLEHNFGEHTSRGSDGDLDAPIYPRIGDISALRDPYSENVDRSFFRFPLWTIHKILYLFDMHQRATFTSGDMQDLASSGSLQSSMDSTTSCDEDVTLVVDDEGFFSKMTLEDESHQGSLPPKTPKGSPPHSTTRDWEMSWYARWELFINLVQRDQGLRQAIPTSLSTTLFGPMDDDASPPEELPELLFQEASILDLVNEGRDMENGDEDEDDSTLVTDLLYSKTFEERYNRGGGFLSREQESKRKRRLRRASG